MVIAALCATSCALLVALEAAQPTAEQLARTAQFCEAKFESGRPTDIGL